MAKQKSGPATKSQQNKVAITAEFARYLSDAERRNERTDALRMARAIALAGLPKRRTKRRQLSRVLRLGSDLWLRVTYSTKLENQELPFGEDRFVLAAIQHLAVEQDSPVVFFERVGFVLDYFGLTKSGSDLRRLRERFSRLANLSIALTFAESESQLEEAPFGDTVYVIRSWALPTRDQLKEGSARQLLIPGLLPVEADQSSPYGVVLSRDFFEHLKEQSNHLVVPIPLLKLFIDCPTGWDYAVFLVHRCSRARKTTKVPHEVLMSLFKDSQEPDRTVIQRLKRFHRQIKVATGGRLRAQLVEDGYFPSTGGRPKKRWALKVSPSEAVVISGKQRALP